MATDTKRIAEAYWGTGPKGPPTAAQRDPHGLGEPPRALTPQLERYCKIATPSLFVAWVILAVIFGAGDILVYATVPDLGIHIPWLAMIFIGLSVWSGRKLSAERTRLRKVLREGNFIEAEVKDIRVIEKRYGRHVVYEYHVDFDLGERRVLLKTRNSGASLLQVGLRDQVLWLESEPDLVVPTFLAASS
jgi:hypothetical protein